MTNLTTPQNGASTHAQLFPATTTSRAAWIAPDACYFQSDHALIDAAARHITVYGVAIYAAISRHAKFDTGEACPTIELLMLELAISEPTACKYVALLESCGMIEKRQSNWGNREQGPKSRNFYRVLPRSKWHFLDLEKRVKPAPKRAKVAPKQIEPNKKNGNKKNVSQQTTTSARCEGLPVVVADSKESVSDPAPQTDAERALIAHGISAKIAADLAEHHAAPAIFQQIAWLEARKPNSRPATLTTAIRGGWSDPNAPRDTAGPHTFQRPQTAQNGASFDPWPRVAATTLDVTGCDKTVDISPDISSDAPRSNERDISSDISPASETLIGFVLADPDTRNAICDAVFESLPETERDVITARITAQLPDDLRLNPKSQGARVTLSRGIRKEVELTHRAEVRRRAAVH